MTVKICKTIRISVSTNNKLHNYVVLLSNLLSVLNACNSRINFEKEITLETNTICPKFMLGNGPSFKNVTNFECTDYNDVEDWNLFSSLENLVNLKIKVYNNINNCL